MLFKSSVAIVFFQVFKGSETSKNDPNQHIAESILNFFSGFDAFCLPPPAYNREFMKDVRRNKDRMNPEFFDEVEKFKDLLKSNVGPKKSCNEGEYVNGEGMIAVNVLLSPLDGRGKVYLLKTF